MTTIVLPETTTGSVVSRDGTRIGYRRTGQGPGLLLVHGSLQSGANFRLLAAALAGRFTVYRMDRRGRGLSGPIGDDYSISRDVEDVSALIEATGMQNVFGLSSGALVTLKSALMLPAIRKIAVYEPPLDVAGQPSAMLWIPPYEKAMAAGDLAGAVAAQIKGTGDRGLFASMPGWVLKAMFKFALNRPQEPGEDGEPSLKALIPKSHFDCLLVGEMAGHIEDFRGLEIPVLLLGGSISASFLPAALDALEATLPDVRRIEFPGLGHIAADNSEQPERIAAALLDYFG